MPSANSIPQAPQQTPEYVAVGAFREDPLLMGGAELQFTFYEVYPSATAGDIPTFDAFPLATAQVAWPHDSGADLVKSGITASIVQTDEAVHITILTPPRCRPE